MNNLLYLWTTFCMPWKLGLAACSFLLGLWFAWLLWSSWARRHRLAVIEGIDLNNNLATLRRQLTEVQQSTRAKAADVSSAMKALESTQPALEEQGEPKRPLSVFPIPKDTSKTNLRGDLIDHRLPREWAKDDVRFDKKLGVLFNKPPGKIDDFTLFEGIDDHVQTKLNEQGFYQYRQLCSMSDDHLTNLELVDPAFAKVHWEFWRHRLRAKGARSGSASLAAGESTRRVLEKKTAEKLAQQRSERQIPVASKPVPTSRPSDDTIAVPIAKPKAAATTDHLASAITPPESSTVPTVFEGEDMVADPKFGWVYRSRPSTSDDFQRLEGMPKMVNEQLHRLGIHKYQQLAHLKDHEMAALETHHTSLREPDWASWRQYFNHHEGLPDVPPDLHDGRITLSPKLGFVYTEAPNKSDDLTALQGIGAETANKLNQRGLYRYDQITHLTDEQIAAWQAEVPELGDFSWSTWRNRIRSAAAESPKDAVTTEVSSPPQTADGDDLTLMQGIDRAAADQLHERGLFHFSQVAAWSDAELTQWQTAGADLNDVSWGAWRNRLRIDGKVEIPQSFANEAIKVSPRLGLIYESEPSTADDLTKLQGVSHQTAKRLNALGLYRFGQLAHLTDSELSQWQTECPDLRNFPWLAWRHRFKTYGDRLEIPQAFAKEPVQVCPRLGLVYPEPPSSVDDFTLLRGMDADCAQRLNALGIFTFQQVSQWSDSEIAHVIGNDACLTAVDWKHWRRYFQRSECTLEIPAAFDGETVQRCPRLGIVYPTAPSNPDNFTLIQGVDASDAEALNRLGIYKFHQIAQLTDGQVTALTEQRAFLKKTPWRRWRRYFRTLGPSLAIPTAFAGESVQHSPDFGVVYRTPPAVPDQLGLIDGLSEDAETRLHKVGIHRFKQIAHLTDDQITALRETGPAFRNVGWNLWRAHLATQGEAKATALARLRRGVPLEFAEQNHIEMDPELGLRYRHTPPNPDLLTKMPGIDATLQASLNRLGIHTFRQLAFLNDQHFAHLRQLDERCVGLSELVARWKATSMNSLEARLGGQCGLGDLWRWDAWRSAHSERLIAHPRFGAIFRSAPESVDDLQRLDGVNADMAAQLNGIGLYQFAQLVQMRPSHFAALHAHHPRLKHLQAKPIQEQASRLIGQTTTSRGRDRWRATHHDLGTGVEVPRS